jgi:hypothetical protein
MVLHQELNPIDYPTEEALKQRCFEVIQKQLLQDNPITEPKQISNPISSSPNIQPNEN